GEATGGACGVTTGDSVAARAGTVRERIPGPRQVLVNNAGVALGLGPIESAQVADWRWMYEVNVLGTLRVTQQLLPALEESGQGTVVVISSTAGLIVYEGGGGYTAAKHAETALAETLRLWLRSEERRVGKECRAGRG